MSGLIHISKGNIKTGAIPSFSLPSGVTCSKEACSTCYLQGCYAKKCERLRPSVRKAWGDNFEIAKSDLSFLETYLDKFFSKPNAPRLFRIHVGGDFFSVDYFLMWVRIAVAHPEIRFLAFTKQTEIIKPFVSAQGPKNFALVFSAWPGVPVDEKIREHLPVAWVDDGNETRIPEDAVHCPGNCETCASCWALDGKDVVFKKH